MPITWAPPPSAIPKLAHDRCTHTNQANFDELLFPGSREAPTDAFDVPKEQGPNDIAPQQLLDLVKSKKAVHIVVGCFKYETLKKIKFRMVCYFLEPIELDADMRHWPFALCPRGNEDYDG